MRPKPMVLVVLDGWGVRSEAANNAIVQAHTPNWDRWWHSRPRALVETSAGHVGLPDGQMGNSEVGHMNLGAGRIVYQDLTRISRAVADGGFLDNPALVAVVGKAVANRGAVHIMGLLSPGGVHSHTDHLLAAVTAARRHGAERIAVHAFLDGRDTPPRSALEYIAAFEAQLARIGAGRIVTVCGRYYAMDRDRRWERVRRAWELLTGGAAETAASAREAVEAAYGRGEDDEFVLPTRLTATGGVPAVLADGDAVLMMNFRADRAREICHALWAPETGAGRFEGFQRRVRPALAGLFTLTRYDTILEDVAVGFPPQSLDRVFGELVSRAGLTQLRAAETEKYAHVTYFFNGGLETPFPGEERLLVPSPQVATYDLKPEMSAPELTDRVIARIAAGGPDLIIVNYANPDMVGHTGVFPAAVRAIEAVDEALGRLAAAVLAAGGELLITSDHGNADCMLEMATGQPHTAHTNNPGPLLYLGREATLADGSLCDVAPTLLRLMDLPQPPEMTGRCLVTLAGADG